MNGGPSGFNNAPVTRTLVIACALFTILFGIQGRSNKLGWSYQDILKRIQVWKLILSVFSFSSTPELIFGIYLLYYFRVFERQIGSNKYSVFILFSVVISLLLEILVLIVFKDPSLNVLASGPYALVFASFVPFYLDIPVSTRFRVFSLHFSDKAFIYIAGLQLLFSSWKRSLLPGICGILAGCLYRLNFLRIRKLKIVLPCPSEPRPSAMKLSFSLGSKPQSSLRKFSATSGTFADKVEKADDREYVTEFDSSKLSVDPSKAKQVRVIPPIPNEWRPYKKMKNLDPPLQYDGADHQQPGVQFEVDPLSSVEPSSNLMSNGLNLRSSNNSTNDKATPAAEKNPSSAVNNGDIRQQMMLREDLRRLTDENILDDYDDMPIEGFGRALLAGYGWKEGQGIGRNGKTKEDVKSVEYKGRTGKEGLGFIGELPLLHLNYGSDNNVKKNTKRQGEKDATGEAQKDAKGLCVGMNVRIIGGRDMGLKATVLEVNREREFVVLRHLKSEEDVKVRVSNIASLGSVEEERCLRKLKVLRTRENNEAPDRRSSKERERGFKE